MSGLALFIWGITIAIVALVIVPVAPVSYTHLTLPTIYSV